MGLRIYHSIKKENTIKGKNQKENDMCILCIEIQKGKMTAREVVLAGRDFNAPKEHYDEIIKVVEETLGAEAMAKAIEELEQEGAI